MSRRTVFAAVGLVVGLILAGGLLLLGSYVYIPFLGDGAAAIHDAASLPGTLHVCGRTWHEDGSGRQLTSAQMGALADPPPSVVDPRQFAPCPVGACGATAAGKCATVIFVRVGEDAYLSYSLSGGP